MRKQLLKYTTMVALGYLPLGVTFGILFNETGYPIVYALAMSIFVYAGSAQFLAITLLLSHAPLYTVFVLTLILNVRHLFYSSYTFEHYSQFTWPKRLYLMFALTDETFSVVSTLPKQNLQKHKLLFQLSMLNHFWWVLGSAIGLILGNMVNIHIQGLEFVLVSLFVVLLVEQLYQTRNWLPIVFGLISATLSFLLFPAKHFLLGALAICLTLFGVYKIYDRLVSH